MPFLSGYTRRKQITIDHTRVGSTLTDFPLLVKIVADTDLGAEINAYTEIAFTADDGTTLLDQEHNDFAASGGQVDASYWVRVPSISSSSDTVIYMYYTAGQSRSDSTAVWDSNFEGVWHLEQDPSGGAPQILDSTSNGRDGTSEGSMTSGELVAGRLANGLSFDGSDDDIDVGAINPSHVTISLWAYLTASDGTDNGGFVANDDPFSSGHGYSAGIRNNGLTTTLFEIGDSGTNYLSQNLDVSLSVNVPGWNHFGFSYSGATLKTFLNGSQAGSISGFSNPLGNSANSVKIGTTPSTFTGMTAFFNSTLDEVRISNAARSGDWISYEYTNQSDASTITIGAEERPTGAAVAIDATSSSAEQTSSSLSWSHTCTGSDRLLLVEIAMESNGGGAGTVTALTYNGAALSLIARHVGASSGDLNHELWGLVSPDTGTHTILVTLDQSVVNAAAALSLTGVHQSRPYSYTHGGAFIAAWTVTPDVDGCLLVGAGTFAFGTFTSDNDERVTLTIGTHYSVGALDLMLATAGPITPAAATTLSWTATGPITIRRMWRSSFGPAALRRRSVGATWRPPPAAICSAGRRHASSSR
jgi:hypothetical protein